SLPARLRRLRGPRRGASGASSREIRVERLEVEANDSAGTLVAVHDGHVELDHDALRLSLALEAAPAAEDGARIRRLQVRLQRSSEGWRVAAATANGVVVRYRER